jgi:hypothetical protein
MVFMQPQRLIVPLFQRPYVWNEDEQWEPLWADVERVAQRLLANPHGEHHAHFLGAVVLQQVQNSVGTLQERTIIDGQQRLTTLQLLLDALQAELQAVGATQSAQKIDLLVTNAEPYWERPEDRYKVWPTNRDQPAFSAVMSAVVPVDYPGTGHRDSRLVQAHEYFSLRSREWLSSGPGAVHERAVAIERAVRELLQMVVIDLTAEENAQEIFETLNARGAQLTAADLVKNFIFQRLTESGVDVQAAYEQYWKDFESGFWETEISAGRVRMQRSSVFLNQWLIAKTGEEIVAREVFYRFKTYADFESGCGMLDLLSQIHRAGEVYRRFVAAAADLHGQVDRIGLFGYRTGAMESEVVKPLVLFLLDPDEQEVPEDQLTKALEVMESWMVRRMLVRVTSKSYSQVIAELIRQIRKQGRERAGDAVEDLLRHQSAANWYWPDDAEVLGALANLQIYRRLPRARLRMLLEAIEDHERGWRGSQAGLGGQRVHRGGYAIEHVLPRRWQSHWPLREGTTASDRDSVMNLLGNLTLLTRRLNAKVSNGPWDGATGKAAALKAHDVLMLNRKLLGSAGSGWDEELIRARTTELVKHVLDIWPVPVGHVSPSAPAERQARRRVVILDLITAGLLEPGATLYPRGSRNRGIVATVLPDGTLDVGGTAYATPSGAAHAVTRTSQNGWSFWLVDTRSKRSLNDLWREYVDTRAVDADDEEGQGADDDDESGSSDI